MAAFAFARSCAVRAPAAQSLRSCPSLRPGSRSRTRTSESGVPDAVDHVRELAAQFNVRELVYDPWRFGQVAQELEREGLLVVAFPQHDSRMIPASSRLHAAIVEHRLTLPDGPEFARHASNTIARHSRRGWRIDKPDPSAIIALAMAVESAEHQPEPVQLLGWL